MIHIHFIVREIYPQPGGMEQAALRVAQALAAEDDIAVSVYTRSQPAQYRTSHPSHGGLDVVHLAPSKELLLEPLAEAGVRPSEALPSSYLHESGRVDRLLLEGEIRRRIEDSPQARHLIVSFYATVSGLIAQQLALELGLPHLAAVRGSDFHRDYRSPYHFHILRFIAENAQVIVTTNHEQARSLQRSVSTQARFVTIHNSTDAPPDRPLWSPPRCDVVRLFADCGFSVKKATHLLLRSVAELVGRGLPVTLTLAGSLADAGQDYWIRCRDRFESEHPGVFSFPGLIDTDEIDESLQGSHIYCSASLSEGCSNARIRALTLGIPIVTTRCGALPEIAAEAAHVRLCPPADLSALTAALESAVRETLEGGIAVDAGPVRRWREHFSPLRERQQWRQAALEAIAGGLRRSP